MRRVWSKFPTDSTKWQNPVLCQQETRRQEADPLSQNQELASYIGSLLVVEGQSLGGGSWSEPSGTCGFWSH